MTGYAQRRHLKYSAAQLFDLVADVERYPEFMPWVTESRIRQRRDHSIVVEMTIAVGPLRKRFSSVGALHRPHRIDISSDDPLFDRFEQRWIFEPAAGGGTNVEYRVDFKFQSRVLQMLMGAAFSDRAVATLAAFKRRAHQLYDDHSQLQSNNA
jgi:coenzyme Q-binding protein COQ10